MFATVFTKKSIALLAAGCVVSSAVLADSSHRGDSHAPIGVMGDHTHKAGEWMFSYRYMTMDMEGNLDGTDDVSSAEIVAADGEYGYMIAAEKMTMAMHMLGGMYAPNDDLTLMLMVPFIDTEMDHVTRMGAEFTTATDGVGDVKAGFLYRLNYTEKSNLIANFSMSFPTGSIEEKDVTAMSAGEDVQLPSPMQLGSGTYDLIPGMTYTVKEDTYSWGAQAKATIRLGDNDHDYTLGNRGMVTAWYARPFANHLSWSVRGAFEKWGNIDGYDSELSAMMATMIATADSDLRAGERFDLAVGVNYIIPGSKTNRLAFEIVKPVYQNLDGPQLETDLAFTLGWQISQ
jgi:hypothetical protein